MKRIVLFACCVAMCAAFAEENVYWSDTPVTCHWIGAERYNNTASSVTPANGIGAAEWTNRNNWAEGIVPGLFVVEQGDGTLVTNGSAGCTAVFGGTYKYRCVDYHGLVSISNILVTGSTAPQYIFNRWQWDPYLPFEQGGSLRVTEDVPVAPYITSRITFYEAHRSGLVLSIENNSVTPLSMDGMHYSVSPWVGNMQIRFEGTGEIHKRANTSYGGFYPCYTLAMSGGKFCCDTSSGSPDFINFLRDVDFGCTQRVEIASGKQLNIGDAGAVYALGNMSISGEGTLSLRVQNNSPVLAAAAGKTLDVSAVVSRPSGTGYDEYGVIVGISSYSGTVRLSGTNPLVAPVTVKNNATLELPSLGSTSSAGPVGTSGIVLSNGTLRYVGTGETTDLSLSGTGTGNILLAGTGDFVWKGSISGGTSAAFVFTNGSNSARFVYANASLAKAITLSSGSRFAFAKPDGGDTIAADSLSIAGDSTLDIGDGVTVTVSALSRSAGTLNVNRVGTGKLIVLGGAQGPMASWITVNGSAAWLAADGSVYSLDSLVNSHTIAAHGDIVPDAPDEAVGITLAGDPLAGNDTLGSATVRMRVLNQETTEPTTIALADGQTLQANLIRVKSGAGDLAIGTEPGLGTVTATEGYLNLQTYDASATLTVNATVAVPAQVPIKTQGAGTNVLAALNGYAGVLSMEGGTTRFAGGAGVDAATLQGTGTVSFAGSAMRLTESGANGVDMTVETDSPIKAGLGGDSAYLKMSGAQKVSVRELDVSKGRVDIDGPILAAEGVSIGMDGATQPDVSFVVGSNGTGIVRFESGAITGRLMMASYYAETSRGAVYQTGGEFVNVTKYGETQVMGSHGYAYYGLYGGRYVAAGDWYLSNDGEGVLDISGGELWHTPTSVHKSRARLGGWVGNAVVRVSGNGVFNATNVAEETILPGYGRYNSSASLTVENGGRMLQDAKGVTIGRGYGDVPCHAAININSGGTVQAPNIVRATPSIYPSTEWPEGTATTEPRYTNMYACVNCNGGTFVNMGWSPIFGERTVSYAYPPNRVTLYEGGLKIDTNGKDCKLCPGGGLQAPSGQGVVSIPWNAATDGQGYIGSPLVMIDGDGKGATAWADFDHETGTVTGIRVTSPGNDYTYANARIIMNKVTLKTIPCTLGTFVSGGLTKIGSGRLKITATNTYAGATTISKGTILLEADDVISPASELVLDGGTLDMNGKAQTFSNIRSTANGGSVINGTPVLSGLAIDFDDVLAGNVYSIGSPVAFAAGAKLTLANADKVTRPPNRYVLATFAGDLDASNLSVAEETLDALPPRWQISFEGQRIILRYPIGAVMSFR